MSQVYDEPIVVRLTVPVGPYPVGSEFGFDDLAQAIRALGSSSYFTVVRTQDGDPIPPPTPEDMTEAEKQALARARAARLIRGADFDPLWDRVEGIPDADELEQMRQDVDAVADVPPRVEAVETALEDKADKTALARVDPGTAGANRQVLRISGGVPSWKDAPTFYARDYTSGTRTENASAGLANLLMDVQGSSVTVGAPGASIELEPGEYRLTETLDLTRFSGRISGAGIGQSPDYYPQRGSGTVFVWDGPAGQPMIRVRDSRGVTLEHFRLEGKDGAKPSYGIEFVNDGGMAGTNEFLVVRDVWIGRFSWTTQGTNKGDVVSGIGFTGTNQNNDQFRLERVTIRSPEEYGVYIPNSQSVGGSIRNLVVGSAGIAGVRTGASVALYDPEFYGCAKDIIHDAGMLLVTDINSEDTGMLIDMGKEAHASFLGGHVHSNDVHATGGVFINAFPSNSLTLTLQDLRVSPAASNPANARIVFGPLSGQAVGRFLIRILNCRGIHPDSVVLGDGSTFYAQGSVTSMGTLEFVSDFQNTIYQFRNEFGHTYRGKNVRQAIDRNVWDMPVTGSGQNAQAVTKTGVLRLAPQAEPPSGEVGDMYMTTAGVLMVCTASGTPGTWVPVGSQT